MLGFIRGKYSTVPIPGAETTLNQADLFSKSKELQVSLIEKLRNDLDENSRRMQLQRRAEENEYMAKTLANVPIPIYIG
jgi:ubiquitin C-terminal hydrolase